MPLPNDGEIVCARSPQCYGMGGTKLNREDSSCWRCGNRDLDRSGVQISIQREMGGQEGVAAVAGPPPQVSGAWIPMTGGLVPEKMYKLGPATGNAPAHDYALCNLCVLPVARLLASPNWVVWERPLEQRDASRVCARSAYTGKAGCTNLVALSRATPRVFWYVV